MDTQYKNEHFKRGRAMAEKGIVLLKNNGILPLQANEQKILVVGFNAENDLAYLGNYFGTPKRYCKVYEGVKTENENTQYSQGYSYNLKENVQLQKEAVEKAENSDLILFCSGLDCSFEGEVQYPFGYGLSYTDFSLENYELKANELHCQIKNTGKYAGEIALQLYMTCPPTDYRNPIRSLIRIQRVFLNPNEEKEVVFSLQDKDFYSVNEQGDTVYLSGEYSLYLFDGQSIYANVGEFLNSNETAVIEKCPI